MPDTSARIKLTKRKIDEMRCPTPGQPETVVRDAAVPGLVMRVRSGGKTFWIEKRVEGRLIKRSLGPYGPMTLDRARTEAHAVLGRLLNGEGFETKRREVSFGDLKTLYLERHAVPKKRARSVENDRSAFRCHLVGWESRRIATITREDVARLHTEIGRAHRYQANRTVALVRKMFNLAKVWGLFHGENPATGIEGFREEKRDRFLQPDDLPRFLEALKEEPNPYSRAALLVALLTGARKMEVLTMRWEDVDLTRGTWRIPETKAHRPHWLPLPTPVVALLGALPRFEGNPYVFPGRKAGRPLTGLRAVWVRIREKAKLPDLWVHDLRRTLGSWLVASGSSLPLIGKALNHSQPSTTAGYARLQLDPVREALEANATRMLTVAGMESVED